MFTTKKMRESVSNRFMLFDGLWRQYNFSAWYWRMLLTNDFQTFLQFVIYFKPWLVAIYVELCSLCKKNWSAILVVSVQHKESDSIKINHDCDQCDYSGTYTNFMQHKLNNHKENKRKCSICLAEFNNKSHLIRQMNSSHKNCYPILVIYVTKDFQEKMC